MIPTHVRRTPAEELGQFVIGQASGQFDFGVWNGMTVVCYSRLEIVHHCCHISRDVTGAIESIHIVAGGQDRPGPFLFVWTLEGLDPDRAACTGMPLPEVSVSM